MLLLLGACSRPGFPEACARKGSVAIVPIGAPAGPALTAWVRDIRKRFALDASITEPVEIPEAAFDERRQQYAAEDLVEAIDRRLRRPNDASSILVGITNRDIFTRSRDWNWAFGLYRDKTAVVSIARMSPSDGRWTPQAERLARERLTKHVARVLGTLYCGFERTGPRRSVMRRQVLGVDDLDEIDLSNWSLGEDGGE